MRGRVLLTKAWPIALQYLHLSGGVFGCRFVEASYSLPFSVRDSFCGNIQREW
jgi:hypothetical protein